MLNPLKQSTDTHVPGEGYVLAGWKTYIVGIVMRPERTRWRLGPDSIAAIVVYALGIAGLVLLS